jgi:hypothetical protein
MLRLTVKKVEVKYSKLHVKILKQGDCVEKNFIRV